MDMGEDKMGIASFFGFGDAVNAVGNVAEKAANIADKYFYTEQEKDDFVKGMVEEFSKSDDRQGELTKGDQKSRHWFIAAWRPALSWTCILSIGVWALITFLLGMAGVFYIMFTDDFTEGVKRVHQANELWLQITLPVENVMLELIVGLTSLAGIRTFEKLKGLTK